MSTEEALTKVKGWTAPGFEQVLKTFEDGFKQGIDKGAALSIYHKGKLVVNIYAGPSDNVTNRLWKEDTYGQFYSGTKFMSSVVIAHMVERGILSYREKVSTYWPEFAQNGKENITLETLLCHKAGISVTKEEFQMQWLRDEPYKLSQFLASTTPLWQPGTKHGYAGLLFGLYLNEIVKRVDSKGRSLAQYYEEEIAGPFELDFHIGLPKSLYHRACRTAWRPIPKEEIMKFYTEEFKGDPTLNALTQGNPVDMDLKYFMDNPDIAELGNGSAWGCGTAKAAAKFAGIMANGGELDGKVLLKPETIKLLLEPLSHGLDCIVSQMLNFSRGTLVFPVRQGNKSWITMGHLGYGGQMIFSDPHYKMGFAYCTNFMEPFTDIYHNRWRHLQDVCYQCISKLENVPGTVKLYEEYQHYLDAEKKLGVTSRL